MGGDARQGADGTEGGERGQSDKGNGGMGAADFGGGLWAGSKRRVSVREGKIILGGFGGLFYSGCGGWKVPRRPYLLGFDEVRLF